jgi:hypothetical protein
MATSFADEDDGAEAAASAEDAGTNPPPVTEAWLGLRLFETGEWPDGDLCRSDVVSFLMPFGCATTLPGVVALFAELSRSELELSSPGTEDALVS